jgi:Ca2+-dependent lipid-binding protein
MTNEHNVECNKRQIGQNSKWKIIMNGNTVMSKVINIKMGYNVKKL